MVHVGLRWMHADRQTTCNNRRTERNERHRLRQADDAVEDEEAALKLQDWTLQEWTPIEAGRRRANLPCSLSGLLFNPPGCRKQSSYVFSSVM